MNNWIKCSEQLPKDNHRVMLCINNCGYYIDIGWLDENGNFVNDYECFSDPVMYWRELPSLPED